MKKLIDKKIERSKNRKIERKKVKKLKNREIKEIEDIWEWKIKKWKRYNKYNWLKR